MRPARHPDRSHCSAKHGRCQYFAQEFANDLRAEPVRCRGFVIIEGQKLDNTRAGGEWHRDRPRCLPDDLRFSGGFGSHLPA